MEFVLDNKWIFLIGAEVSFWALSVAFLLLRYLFDLGRASVVVLALIILDDLFIAGLGALDYLRTGEFAIYQFIAAAIIVYGLTFGKQDFKRLDAYLKRRVARWKGQASPPEVSRQKTGHEKARYERRRWYGHLAIFAVGQVILLATGDSWIAAQLAGNVPGGESSGLMQAGRIWCLVFLIDTIWSLSYTVFPRRTQTSRAR